MNGKKYQGDYRMEGLGTEVSFRMTEWHSEGPSNTMYYTGAVKDEKGMA